MKYLLLCLLATFSVFNASATVYFVDSKLTSTCKNSYSIAQRSCTGSDGTAYSTLAEAAASAVAGDTVFIREGTYNQQLAPKNSGTENAPITFKNYQQEVVLLTGVALNPAIWIDRKHYIIIDGLTVANVTHWMSVLGATHITLQNCTFKNATDPAGSSKTGIFFQNSNYNSIIHNTIDSSSQDNLAFINSDYNLVQLNTITRAAHTLWTIKCSRHNVIKYNVFHNQLQKIGEIYDCDEVGYGSTDFPKMSAKNDTQYNLIEGNVFAYTATPIDRSPYAGIQLAAQHTIVRRNIFFNCIGPPIDLTNYAAEAEFTTGNRIYHNTFYHNHFGGMSLAGVTGYAFSDNVIVNNIFYKNNFIKYDSRWAWYSELDTKPVQLITGRTDGFRFEKNALFNSTPNERYLITYGSRTSTTNPAPQPISAFESGFPSVFIGNLQVEPYFVDTTKINMRLMSKSELIDKGAFIAKAVNSGSNATTLIVDDAGFFSDGFGLTNGDTIQFENQQTTAIVQAINYTTNTLTLTTPLSWQNGQGLSLKYSGKAPEMGVYEYEPPSAVSEELPAVDEAQSILLPNPAHTSVRVRLMKSGTVHTIMIFNYLGERIYQASGSDEFVIDTHTFASGVYNCVLFSDGIPTVERLVIVR
ncbi:MAG: right-handed parallel beta-helix repeat-containing protein [Candidatus Kapaibacterium sp.]